MLFADDLVCVDHWLGGFGAFGAETAISLATETITGTRTRRLEVVSCEVVGQAVLMRQVETAETLEGDEIVWDVITVGVVIDGRLRRIEAFGADAASEARARFDQLVQR
jgi:hypothetical protein